MDPVPLEEQPHTINLVSENSSKILNVSLYTSRAEITRSYSVTLGEGSTTVNISGLPNVLENESLRVEGRGTVIIQDVSISATNETRTPSALEDLKSKQRVISKALSRCKVASSTLEDYMYNAGSKSTDTGTQLQEIMDQYNESGKKLDRDEVELKKELQTIEESIQAETKNALMDPLLKKTVSVNLLAGKDSQVELLVIYVVWCAGWYPLYDIRVNMQSDSDDKPVTIVYKAVINQITGESWNGVPLTLKTASPSYDVSVPGLQPWFLSVLQPPIETTVFQVLPDPDYYWSSGQLPSGWSELSLSLPRVPDQVVLESKGNLSETLRVPGLISIPGDGQSHTVIVSELKFDAIPSWIAVPEVDKQVHLHAKIKNDSEYTFVAGTARVYVDGSFVATTKLPAVCPQETFDCALGVDPSIRVTYHPISEKRSESGLIPFTRKTTFRYSQRTSILNTKTASVQCMTIRNAIPVSKDERVVVKLTSPALPMPSPSSKGSKLFKSTKSASSPKKERSRVSFDTSSLRSSLTAVGSVCAIKEKADTWKEMGKLPGTLEISNGVLAQWAEVGEPNFDESAMGKSGQINWILSLQPGEALDYTVEWEVSFPKGVDVVGL